MRISHAATLLVATTLLVTTVGATPSTGDAAAAPQPRARQVCDRTWEVVDTPQINPPGASIRWWPDLSVVSRDAVWFGFDQYGAGDGSGIVNSLSWPLRWDGRSVESAPPVPRPRTAAGSTFAFSHTAAPGGGPQTVSFDSAEHGWLLTTASAMANPLSEGVPVGYRWHEGRWTMTPLAASPDPRLYVPNPADVASLSPSDAWLVGSLERPGQAGYHGALIEHWDGTSWQLVDNPLANERHVALRAVEAVSPTDVWAVGGRYTFDGPVEPVVMHWDGSEWSVVPTPTPAGSVLHSISAVGSDDVWVVGSQSDDNGGPQTAPLLMRWDGTEWTVVADFPGSVADDVYAATATDVWVISRPGFQHWNGSTWRTVEKPGTDLYGMTRTINVIDGTGPDNIWVAGRAWDGQRNFSPVIYRLSCDRPGRGSR